MSIALSDTSSSQLSLSASSRQPTPFGQAAPEDTSLNLESFIPVVSRGSSFVNLSDRSGESQIDSAKENRRSPLSSQSLPSGAAATSASSVIEPLTYDAAAAASAAAMEDRNRTGSQDLPPMSASANTVAPRQSVPFSQNSSFLSGNPYGALGPSSVLSGSGLPTMGSTRPFVNTAPSAAIEQFLMGGSVPQAAPTVSRQVSESTTDDTQTSQAENSPLVGQHTSFPGVASSHPRTFGASDSSTAPERPAFGSSVPFSDGASFASVAHLEQTIGPSEAATLRLGYPTSATLPPSHSAFTVPPTTATAQPEAQAPLPAQVQQSREPQQAPAARRDEEDDSQEARQPIIIPVRTLNTTTSTAVPPVARRQDPVPAAQPNVPERFVSDASSQQTRYRPSTPRGDSRTANPESSYNRSPVANLQPRDLGAANEVPTNPIGFQKRSRSDGDLAAMNSSRGSSPNSALHQQPFPRYPARNEPFQVTSPNFGQARSAYGSGARSAANPVRRHAVSASGMRDRDAVSAGGGGSRTGLSSTGDSTFMRSKTGMGWLSANDRLKIEDQQYGANRRAAALLPPDKSRLGLISPGGNARLRADVLQGRDDNFAFGGPMSERARSAWSGGNGGGGGGVRAAIGTGRLSPYGEPIVQTQSLDRASTHSSLRRSNGQNMGKRGGRGAPAMSEAYVGRNVRVRAIPVRRAVSPTTAAGAAPAFPSVHAGSMASNNDSMNKMNGSNGAAQRQGTELIASTKNVNGLQSSVAHAEDAFMSLISGLEGGKQRKEKPRPGTLFASDSSPAVPAGSVAGSSGTTGRSGQNALNFFTKPLRAFDFMAPRSTTSKEPSDDKSGGKASGGAGGGGGGGGGGKGGGGGDDGGDEFIRQAKKAVADEDDRDEQAYKRGRNNASALHVIPWDQRSFVPRDGFGTSFFSMFTSSFFWERIDWTVRSSLLTVLPAMILSLEPSTQYIFPLPSSFAFLAFWITMPTFGAGLRELYVCLKGYALSIVFLCVIIAIHPEPDWLILLILFIATLIASFVAEELRRTAAYCLATFVMQYQSDKMNTGFPFVGDYFKTLLLGLAFGLAAFIVPFIRWSSDLSKKNCFIMGNSMSIAIQGVCASFWTSSPLDRELNVVRLRQLTETMMQARDLTDTYFDEAIYEPHSGRYLAAIRVRFNLLKYLFNILGSMSQVIELINDNPELIETPMCISFGSAIKEDLAIIASAMDSTVLKICDFRHPIRQTDINFFKEARMRFQEAVSEVRQEVILNNEMYETDESDVFLGFFLFSVDELAIAIENFKEDHDPPSTIMWWLKMPWRDLQSSYNAFSYLFKNLYSRRALPRRAKEAIKLSLCMVIPSIFQVYALGGASTSPVAGAAIIAFVYQKTGAESFQYATNRVLGTVLGSLTAYFAVLIASQRRWVLYIFVALLSFIGSYVQTGKGFYACGNAICNSVISIITQYQDPSAAMIRIQQNVFAILIFFCISTVIWPSRAHRKLTLGLDTSLRCLREAAFRLLRNLDMPDDVDEVGDDVSALLGQMMSKIGQQQRFLPAAIREPTLVGSDFPDKQWGGLIAEQRTLWSIMSMMRYAYVAFQSKKMEDDTELSVHWVVLRRISPYARDLSDLIYAVVDLYLLSIGGKTFVPATHLTRLRHGMLEAQREILETYCRTITRKLDGESSIDNTSYESGGYDGSDDDGIWPGREPREPRMSGSGGGGGGGDNGDASIEGFSSNDDGPIAPYNPNAAATSGNQGDGNQKNNNNNNNSGTGDREDAGKPAEKQEAGDGTKKANGLPPRPPKRAVAFADDDKGNGDDGNKKQRNGYLAYDLTPEEEEELKKRVLDRTIRNKSFAGVPMGSTPDLSGSIAFPNNANSSGTGKSKKRASSSADGHSDDDGDGKEGFLTKSFRFGKALLGISVNSGVSGGISNASMVGKPKGDADRYRKESADENEERAAKKRSSGLGSNKGRGSRVDNNSMYASPGNQLSEMRTVEDHDPFGNRQEDDDDGEFSSKEGNNEERKQSGKAGQSDHSVIVDIAPFNGGGANTNQTGTTDTSTDLEKPPLLFGSEKEFAEKKDEAGSKAGGGGDDKGHQQKVNNRSMFKNNASISFNTGKAPATKKSMSGLVKGLRSPISTSSSSYYRHRDTDGMTGNNKIDEFAELENSAHVEQLLANLSFFNADKREFVLSNKDVHSLEAFLFGIRAFIRQIGEFQKTLLELHHVRELAKCM